MASKQCSEESDGLREYANELDEGENLPFDEALRRILKAPAQHKKPIKVEEDLIESDEAH